MRFLARLAEKAEVRGNGFAVWARRRLIRGLFASALGVPHTAALMVADRGQVAVLLAPGDFVHVRCQTAPPGVGIELIPADTLDDPSHRAPVDLHQPADRALVGP